MRAVALVVTLTAMRGLAFPRAAHAKPGQAMQRSTGVIVGRITDSSGGVLPGATVTVENSGTHVARAVPSNETGDYRVDQLSSGNYSVTVELQGFTRQTVPVNVQADADVRVDVKLQIAATAYVEVTARRRAEDLQSVPLSVAADSTETLQAKSVQSLADLGQVTPNFLYGQKIQSGSSAGQVYIRGIGQQDTNTAFSPGVGLYVDGVYLGRAQANDVNLSDVQRVEVLYGPQGTLFGKNSNGGVINIVTSPPDLGASRSSGTVRAQTGAFGRLDASGLLNVPLITDQAALQIGVERRGQDGYSKRTDGQELADQNRTSGRVQLFVKPARTFEAAFRLDATTFDEHTAAYRLVDVRETSTIPVLYAQLTPYRYDDRWVTASDFQYNGTGPNKNAGHVWGTSATLTWERPWAVLKSITAYRTMYIDSQFDPDGSPLTVLDVFNTIHQHQVSQEFQASGTSFAQKVHWVGGLYYFREAAHEEQPVNIALELFHGDANFNPIMDVLNRNYAVFGQADVNLTDRLKLTLGGRVGDDAAEAGLMHVGYPNPTLQQPLVTRSASWGSFLPRLGLEYQFAPAVMAYASAAEGSKSGARSKSDNRLRSSR